MIDQKERKNRIKGKDKIKGERVQNRRKIRRIGRKDQKNRKERFRKKERNLEGMEGIFRRKERKD